MIRNDEGCSTVQGFREPTYSFQMLIYAFAFSLLLSPVSGSCRTAGGIFKPGIRPVTLFSQAARESLKLPLTEDLQPFFRSGHLGDGGSRESVCVCVWCVRRGGVQACEATRVTAVNQDGSLSSPWSCFQRWMHLLYA